MKMYRIKAKTLDELHRVINDNVDLGVPLRSALAHLRAHLRTVHGLSRSEVTRTVRLVSKTLDDPEYGQCPPEFRFLNGSVTYLIVNFFDDGNYTLRYEPRASAADLYLSGFVLEQ